MTPTDNKQPQGAHTAGPWDIAVEDGRIFIFLPNSYLGNHIAYLSDGGVPEDQEEANARLIAAAPDMFEALRLVRTSTEWSCMEREIQDAIEAAISRAQSEQGE